MSTPHTTSNPAQGPEYGHTPGPWEVEEGGGNNLRVVGTGNDNSAVLCEMPTWNCRPEECEANAALMALAPDLLRERDQLRAQLAHERAKVAELVAALEDMHSGWRYIRAIHGDLHGVGWNRTDSKARAALARAKEASK